MPPSSLREDHMQHFHCIDVELQATLYRFSTSPNLKPEYYGRWTDLTLTSINVAKTGLGLQGQQLNTVGSKSQASTDAEVPPFG